MCTQRIQLLDIRRGWPLRYRSQNSERRTDFHQLPGQRMQGIAGISTKIIKNMGFRVQMPKMRVPKQPQQAITWRSKDDRSESIVEIHCGKLPEKFLQRKQLRPTDSTKTEEGMR